MNSLVNYVLVNGGVDYDLAYPQSMLKGKWLASNSSCTWYNNQLIINSRLTDYFKFFQNKDFRISKSNIGQSYFLWKRFL